MAEEAQEINCVSVETSVIVEYSRDVNETKTLPQLTEDILEQHTLEVDILQSIFPDHFVLENIGSLAEGIYSFQVNVEVFLPGESVLVEVLAPIDTDLTAIRTSVSQLDKSHRPVFQEAKSETEWFSELRLRHLPPITLHVSLPPEYPANELPFYTISSGWLGANSLSTLCKKLDDIWLENKGDAIIYIWIEWLQNNALRYLGFEEQLTVIQQNLQDIVDCNCDPRALPTCFDIVPEICHLLSYDYDLEVKAFNSEYQTCSICFLEDLGSEFCRLRDCEHHFCHDCLSSYCEMLVKEGSVLRMNCPSPDCDHSLPKDIIEAVLSPEAVERWERILLQRALELMGDIVWCPRCQQATVREPEEDLNLAYCLACNFAFCLACDSAWHQGAATCGEMTEPVKKSKKGRGSQKNRFKEKDGDDEDNTQNKEVISRVVKRYNTLSRNLIRKEAKKCPKCRVPITKDGGCNKITCSLCFTYFCWICGKSIQGYDHFSDSCILFTYETAAVPRYERPDPRPEELVQYLDENARKARDLLNCPRCHQINLKMDNNNHLKCWACKSNLCYYCKKVIEGVVSKHFIGGTCKQHSDKLTT